MEKLIIKTKNWTRNSTRNRHRHFDVLGFISKQYPKLYEDTRGILNEDLRHELVYANDCFRGQLRREQIRVLLLNCGLEVEFR